MKPLIVESVEADNMGLWNRRCNAADGLTKPANIGAYRFSSINTYAFIKAATEEWGPIGGKWWFETEYELVSSTKDEMTLVKATVSLHHPIGPHPKVIVSCAPLFWTQYKDSNTRFMFDDDAYVKAESGGKKKALSFFGFCVNVYMEGKGAGDDKYENAPPREMTRPPARRVAPKSDVRKAAANQIARIKELSIEVQGDNHKDYLAACLLKVRVGKIEDITDTQAVAWIRKLQKNQQALIGGGQDF